MAKVYVSSTIDDLKLERKAVIEWLIKARQQPIESYLPSSDTTWESCLDDVHNSDMYVLILGNRYGNPPRGSTLDQLSMTHLEYRQAGKSGIPRIALLKTTPNDSPEIDSKVLKFREEIRSEVRPAEFDDLTKMIQALSTGVHAELQKLMPSTVPEKIFYYLLSAFIIGKKFIALGMMVTSAVLLTFRWDVINRMFTANSDAPFEELFFPIFLMISGLFIYFVKIKHKL